MTRRAGLAATAGLALVAGTLGTVAAGTAAPAGDGYLGDLAGLAGLPEPSGELTHEPTGAWFVELTAKPVADGGSRAAAQRQQDRVLAQAEVLGADLDVRYTYDRLWNGFSVSGSEADVTRLAASAEVAAVYPVVTVDAPDPATSEPAMDSALGMTGADVAQSELGFTGDGLKVGVIDSGVDIDHPDLGGSGTPGGTAFPTERVVAGYDFVGDDYNADDTSAAYQPVPHPDDNPDDCLGHGSHVAGIVGADGDSAAGGVRGVAPDVEFGAYRVFGCGGSTTSDIMLAAMERAHADGMDVVNMSIGAGFVTWPEYPTATASDALVDEGVVVVASIGNNGAAGTWSAGAPGVGEKVIGVASFDNTEYDARMFTVTPDGREFGYADAAGAPSAPTSGDLPMSRTGTPASTADACTATGALPDLTGTVALIERGTCSFYEKARNAQQAGAAAVVLYNNVAGAFAPTVAPPTPADPPITIPVVAVPQAEGVELDSRIAAGATTLTWTDETTTVENSTAGLISSFSSYGMASDLTLKPDLGAPGGLIRSTYPLEEDGYAVVSGTSMASPHVAGAVALLLQAHPSLTPAQVRDQLQNTADPADWSLVPGAGYFEPAHRQGAGMLDIDDAILAPVSVSPGKLSLGESSAGPAERTLTLTNDGDAPVTYALSHVDGITTAGAPNNPQFFEGGASVAFSPSSVTVPAGSSVSVEVTVTAPAEPDLGQYGGWVVLTPSEGQPLRVPFAGFAGDYQQLPILTPTGAGLPELGDVTACDRYVGVNCTMGGEFDLLPDGATFSMTEGDYPVVIAHLEHAAQNVSLQLFHAKADGTAGRPYGRLNTVLSEDYVGRSSAAGAFNAYTWDGTRPRGSGTDQRVPVPDGRYVLRLTAAKPLADPADPAHVETWDSPVIVVDRN
ncbi:S8 family serine peptidase [Jiangella anatolica]|uniref:S8 family serine peptidase n=1 Tax=Jiangella anatolica TaxID=2670374 RepID=UPI0018F7838E|nr:S8 family serine peptidase [Jiangella anatolica]